ncbi:ATP-dependent nuclease, subunit A [Streptococcus sp. DD10]|nr:ATP-dependent nuclease, subunit A [Streptococcus sp. DD10]
MVSASAGSGKTFVMVQRILDQLMRGISVNQLFISTFTVKAATELKERLEKEIEHSLAETDDEELKRHLSQQLAELPTADIGTMDSFTQKLLGRYGYLLSLSPTYRILQNESEQRILQNEVFDQLFEEYYKGPKKQLFEQTVKNFTGKAKSIAGFRNQIYHIYSFLQSTSSPQDFLDKVFLKGYEGADYEGEKGVILERTYHTLLELENFFRFHLDGSGREFSKAKYQENVFHILDEIASLTNQSSQEEQEHVLRRVVSISRLSNGRALTITTRKEELKELATDFNEERKQLIADLRGYEKELYTLDFLQKYHHQAYEIAQLLRDFVRDFSKRYLERKRQENAFEFGDVSHFAIQILEDFPEVRSFYQSKYHEVMVDEYQDTNHTQERMLTLLSNGKNRFMVGDIKQSIYRFRQADPMIFSEKFQRYQEMPEEGKCILLKENFRSHVEVLDATNDVFKHLMDQSVGEIDYNNTHYLVAGNPKKAIANTANQAKFLIYDKDGGDADSQDEITAGEVLLVIKEIIRLHNEEGVEFKDITLLTAARTRNDLILSEFEKHHIPIVADGGEANYLQSVEVMVMLDTLRVINNPLNDYALVALLKSPMFTFNEDELTRISLQASCEKSKEFLYEKLQNALKQKGIHSHLIDEDLRKKLNQFEGFLLDWRTFSRSHSLYDLIWRIYQDRLYYDYVGALPNGAQRQANLYALALRAHEFEKANFKGLSRFIHMINKIIENEHDLTSVATPVPQNAVNLMTIHKSKGLEFSYVFVLNVDKSFSKRDTSASSIISRNEGIGLKYVADVFVGDQDPQSPQKVRVLLETLPYQNNRKEHQLAHLSEQMRLLYVAMTRAETKLYLVGKGNQEKLAEKNWNRREQDRLAKDFRLELSSFQDWLYAIQVSFQEEDLAYKTEFVTDDDLTEAQVGSVKQNSPVFIENQVQNRQSDDIRKALAVLENVDRINSNYQAAIELASVRTPSQIKKFYESVMDNEGVAIMQEEPIAINFKLPDFTRESPATGAAIGSAIHELMQRISLDNNLDLSELERALSQVQANATIKEKINLEKILAFFSSELGQLIIAEKANLYREAPFAMLKQDDKSGEKFVVRGILDGYLVLDDRLVLFDYKTDVYQSPHQLVERYRQQLNLYAEALTRSYGIQKVEKYLVLLGGPVAQVVEVDSFDKE